jgi:hypothetical protein
VAQRSPSACPLPAPPSLEERIELPPAGGNGDLAGEPFKFEGATRVGKTQRVFGSLPSGRGWHRSIRSGDAARPGEWIYRDDPIAGFHDGIAEGRQSAMEPGAAEGVADRSAIGGDIGPASGPEPRHPARVMRADLLRVLQRLSTSTKGRLVVSIMLVLLAVDAWLYLVQHVSSSAPALPVETRNQADPDPKVVVRKPGVMFPRRQSSPRSVDDTRTTVPEHPVRDPGLRGEPATLEQPFVRNTPVEGGDVPARWSGTMVGKLLLIIVIGGVAGIIIWSSRRP